MQLSQQQVWWFSDMSDERDHVSHSFNTSTTPDSELSFNWGRKHNAEFKEFHMTVILN